MPRSGGPVTVVKNTQRNKIVMYGMRLMQTGAHHVISSARKVILDWPGSDIGALDSRHISHSCREACGEESSAKEEPQLQGCRLCV